MNHHAMSTCLLLSALLSAATLPLAHAGGAITRCIDGAGRITLTDQACDVHTVSSSIAVPGMQDDAAPVAGPPAFAVRAAPVRAAPMRATRWLPAAAPHAALSGDIATLQQARIQMLLQDGLHRSRLASLDR